MQFDNLRLVSPSDLSETDYHADTTRISASMIKTCWSKTPAHVYAQYFDPKRERAIKSSFTFGSMFHAAILEQSEFDNRFVIVPEGIDRRTKDGKTLWVDIEASGKQAIKATEWQAAQAMVEKLMAHSFFAENPLRC